jgi:AcrR family transcriptional regulator
MPRKIPPGRLERLLDCATRVFIELGYRRTQMADVAAALGVAKGTLYLYVESKEALFDLVLRHADGTAPRADEIALPVPTPKRGATLAHVGARLAEEGRLPLLAAALARRRVADVRAELAGILRELHTTLARNRRAIKLVDRCAHDYPELAEIWFQSGRVGQLALLIRYLEAPARKRRLRRFPDTAVAARMILETVTFWAVHRHWDPAPQEVDEQAAEDTVVTFILGAVVKED